MAIQSINVHGEILEADLTPAVGTVTFRILHELRDTVDNITLTPTDFVATLDVNGEFTITLPTTDNPDITPLDWSYQVYVSVATWRDKYYIELPFALGPTAEFADLIPLDDPQTCTPDGTACAPISLVGQVAALESDLDVVEVTVGALVGQVNTITPIVLDNQADIAALEANVVYKNPPLVAGNYVGNPVTPPPGAPNTVGWFNMATPIPFSAGDTNPDFLRVSTIDEFGNTVHTTTLNGNGEGRDRPSTRGRVARRTFESAEAVGYSTAQFWQVSSNPTIAANREPYLGVWGTASAKPGWAEATRVLSGLAGVSIGGTANAALAPYNTLSAFNYRGLKTTPGAPAAGTWAVNDVILDSLGVVYRCTVAGTPGTWVGAVPTTLNVTSFTGTTASAALISDGAATGAPYVLSTSYNAAENRVWMDGAISNTGGVSIPGGTTLFTVNALHAPIAWVQFNERTSTTLSARVTIKPDGTVRLDQPLAAGATCSFDGLNWRKN